MMVNINGNYAYASSELDVIEQRVLSKSWFKVRIPDREEWERLKVIAPESKIVNPTESLMMYLGCKVAFVALASNRTSSRLIYGCGEALT